MARVAYAELQDALGPSFTRPMLSVETSYVRDAGGDAYGLTLAAQTYEGDVLGACATSDKKSTPEIVARSVASELAAALNTSAPVDKHLADQVVQLVCLAGGVSRVEVAEATGHLETAVEVVRVFGLDAAVER
eukprot:CAMPEP_0174900504 /NCGR_PEP_ID=MMETSP0167-20121228/31499_1 /TAXON_ID=38298 /ORGANISM="Rhodella maculata, Strain CCMP736" /LENGTH=132 /DNA_ID=CAMNT_0016141897 /DNA_START=74 /DNA_END=469 /DNA_ORIENTATION=+